MHFNRNVKFRNRVSIYCNITFKTWVKLYDLLFIKKNNKMVSLDDQKNV